MTDADTAASMANARANAGLPVTSGDYEAAADSVVPTAATVTPEPEAVPDKAADVVAWLDASADADTAVRRAQLAEDAELTRTGDPRKQVLDAIDAARDRATDPDA